MKNTLIIKGKKNRRRVLAWLAVLALLLNMTVPALAGEEDSATQAVENQTQEKESKKGKKKKAAEDGEAAEQSEAPEAPQPAEEAEATQEPKAYSFKVGSRQPLLLSEILRSAGVGIGVKDVTGLKWVGGTDGSLMSYTREEDGQGNVVDYSFTV